MSYVDILITKINDAECSTPIEAAIYSRVSTRNESQKDSCENQIKSAKEHIAGFSNVVLSQNHIFKDNGISGKSVVGRTAYQKLMSAVRSGEFKLIVAKTCSRLFRDVTESQDFLRTMIKNSAVLYTLEDNHFWDFTNHSDELMFTLLSVFNSGTSRTQSDAGHSAQERRVNDKKLMPRDIINGFKWDSMKKDIIIDEDIAPIIINIFELYVYRNGTPASICKFLKDHDIKFPKHKRDEITRKPYIVYEYICERTISNMITNRKYIGYFTINTRSSIFIPGEESMRYKTPESEHQVVVRPDLQIVDTDLFEMAQRIRHSRITVYEKPNKKTVQAHFQGTHLFAGKIFCPVCGKPYRHDYADRKKTTSVYRMTNHKNCPNEITRIYEADLEEMTRKALKLVITEQSNVLASLEKILIECVEATQNNGDEINKLKKQKIDKEKKIDSLIDALMDDGLNDEAKEIVKSKLNSITDEIKNLTDIIEDMESNKLSFSYVTDKIDEIKSAIEELKNFTIIDRERIQNFIERIDVQPNSDIDICLKSGQIITLNQLKSSDFTEETNVGKKRIQDGLY